MNTQTTLSSFSEIFKEASQYIAGGVVSLNRKVTPNIVFRSGKGSKIVDIEGKEYIDYHAGFAPYLLGHNYGPVNDAVIEILQQEWSLIGSGTNELEIKLAGLLCKAVTSLELIQITNTGSEATAHAIRLSRAYTGREDIILTIGGYNGWHNEVARAVMPSLAELGPRVSPGEYPFVQMSAGIPENTKRRVHLVNYNDLASIEYVLKRYPVACILTEPVLQNVGVVLPQQGYLQGLIDLCEQHGAVCIFDEVKTGFRCALGGYQGIAGVMPHLSVFGKAVANGYPLGVIGGKREIMELFDSPDADKRVLIAGTYNAHPVNTAAAIATLSILNNPGIYAQIAQTSNLLYGGLQQLFSEKGIAAAVSSNASAYCVYFTEKTPTDLHDILENVDFEFDLKYRRALIEKGVYNIPIACKQGSVSFAHTEDDIYKTLDLTREVLQEI
jgi:glutamate-1-semialdehyde 2,1-aminomutase